MMTAMRNVAVAAGLAIWSFIVTTPSPPAAFGTLVVLGLISALTFLWYRDHFYPIKLGVTLLIVGGMMILGAVVAEYNAWLADFRSFSYGSYTAPQYMTAIYWGAFVGPVVAMAGLLAMLMQVGVEVFSREPAHVPHVVVQEAVAQQITVETEKREEKERVEKREVKKRKQVIEI